MIPWDQSMENDIGLIIQLPISESWGTDEEFDLGCQLEIALDELFRRHGCGIVDGNDVGSGSMNIFTYTNEENWNRALDIVLGELKKHELLEKVIIAKSVPIGEDDRGHQVIWPKDFKGEFALF
jgi:hypothetical protein